MLREATDMRKEYAEELRRFADQVEQMDYQPVAMRTHVFLDKGGSLYNSCTDAGANLFQIIGFMQTYINKESLQAF